MFRLPKSSSQSPAKKVVVIGMPQNNQECKFPHRKCNLLCLENYNYCLKHILEDKSAPYKPCPYIYTVSGKKCGKAAYRPDRKDTWFCPEHSRKAHLIRQKASIKHAPPMTKESLLASLSHYAPAEPSSVKKEESETEESSSKPQTVNPFVSIDAASINNAHCSKVLDYASESDSDLEPAMLDNVWRAQDHESSDAESVDSQAEDPLKHAGVYTAEEVTNIIKDKMIRLQSLYIDQFRRLHHLLRERRRKYVHALKKEKETLCSIHDQDKSSPKEYKLYQKLKALNHYHRYYGEEAVLHKKSLERRAQATEGNSVRSSHKGKCAFTEGGVKCGAKTLPVTKYCRKHILEDSQQVLFRACGFKRDDHVCQEPTVNIFENATCVYHITLPSQPHTTLDANETTDVKLESGNVPNSQEETPMDNQIDACSLATSMDSQVATCSLATPMDSEIATCSLMTPMDSQVATCSLATPLDNQMATCSLATPMDNEVATCTLATTIDSQVATGSLATTMDSQVATCSLATPMDSQVATCSLATPMDSQVATCSLATPIDNQVDTCSTVQDPPPVHEDNSVKPEKPVTTPAELQEMSTRNIVEEAPKPVEDVETIDETTAGLTAETAVVQPSNKTEDGISKMETGDEPNNLNPSTDEPPKENINGEELVMVDITDVGVVEEVLESEEKLEADEKMQVDQTDKTDKTDNNDSTG